MGKRGSGAKSGSKAPQLGATAQTPSGIVVPADAVAATETPTHKAENVKKGSVVVEWKEFGKVHTRAYNEQDNGEDFEEKAKGFAEKKGGKIVK